MSLPRGFLTLLPPPSRWSEDEVLDYVGIAKGIVEGAKGVAINVPEVVPLGRREGRPVSFRPKMNLLRFASLLLREGLRTYLDRYAPLMGREDYVRFLSRASSIVEGVVVVGKLRSDWSYPGYDVLPALTLARRYFERVGAIMIFEREGEVERVCAKVEAGATFFVSQITFSPERVANFMDGLKRECVGSGLSFPPIYVSLAPVFTDKDRALLEWMEVEVPPSPPPPEELARRMLEIPGVAGINYEHLRYGNLSLTPRVWD